MKLRELRQIIKEEIKKSNWESLFEEQEIIVINYFLENLTNDRREYDIEDLESSGVPKKYSQWVYEQLNDSDNYIYYETISKIIKFYLNGKLSYDQIENYFEEFESAFDSEAYEDLSDEDLIDDVMLLGNED